MNQDSKTEFEAKIAEKLRQASTSAERVGIYNALTRRQRKIVDKLPGELTGIFSNAEGDALFVEGKMPSPIISIKSCIVDLTGDGEQVALECVFQKKV